MLLALWLSAALGQDPAVAVDGDAPVRLLFPGGRSKAVTMSFDDGRAHDYRLVEALNRHGLKATFHLVSGLLDRDGYVKKADVATLYKGHEVASHTVHHAILPRCSDEKIASEILDDRKELERLTGRPVQGLAYPGGECDDRVAALLPALGIRYAREVGTHHGFSLPKKPHRWAATCSIGDMLQDGRRFLEFGGAPVLFFVWGHSYEFEERNAWGTVDDFGALVGKRPEIWYATNLEVIDYKDAVGKVTVSGGVYHNPGTVPVWVSAGGKAWELKPGERTRVTVP
jgi:peptidoglycan/xylan/chitin deacetylase (PgdA/CDA1 family)